MSCAVQLLDAAGRRRSPATLSDFHAGRAPGNKGQRYAADPPTVDEIMAVMRHAAHARYGNRLNGLIVVLWRAGLRINEALSLTETDLEEQRGSVLVRHGKNDRRRQVGMDAWGWTALGPWLAERAALPVGPLFCVIAGPTAGHAWSASAARLQLHQVAVEAGVRRRFAPHQLRHAHAVDRLTPTRTCVRRYHAAQAERESSSSTRGVVGGAAAALMPWSDVHKCREGGRRARDSKEKDSR